jgi:hypothetical protein
MELVKELNGLQLSIFKILFRTTFDKVIMKSQSKTTLKLPLELNPFTWLWHTISSSRVLCHNLLQYLKLDERNNVLVLGNVEYEHCFSSLKFLKYSLCNRLSLYCFPMVVKMY